MNFNNGSIEYNEEAIFVGFDFTYDKWNLVKAAFKIAIENDEPKSDIKIDEIVNRSGNFLRINNFIIQVIFCSHFDNEINFPIKLINKSSTPHLLLAAQVDEENNIVYFPGVLTMNELRKLKSNQTQFIDNIIIPISNFEGGIDLLFRYVNLLNIDSIPKRIFEESKKNISLFDFFNKKNSLVAIGLGTILASIFAPKAFQPNLVSNFSVLEGDNFLIADNTRSENINKQNSCILSPQLKATDTLNQYKYYISIDKPVLLFKDSLNEIKIIKDNKEIWRKTATSDNKIIGPLYWPIKSFEVNDSYVLRVRPDGIPMGNYADIKLEASKDKITKLDQLENSLDKNEYKWIREINKNISKNPDLSIALLFSKNIPNSEVLEKTKKTFIFDSNCD